MFGEKDVDTRADVWSFGVMLYECVTGKKPFVGDNFGQIFKQVAMGEITPVETHTPEVPAELGALILAMLARDRAARPSDWPAIIAVLEAKPAPLTAEPAAGPSALLLVAASSAPPVARGSARLGPRLPGSTMVEPRRCKLTS